MARSNKTWLDIIFLNMAWKSTNKVGYAVWDPAMMDIWFFFEGTQAATTWKHKNIWVVIFFGSWDSGFSYFWSLQISVVSLLSFFGYFFCVFSACCVNVSQHLLQDKPLGNNFAKHLHFMENTLKNHGFCSFPLNSIDLRSLGICVRLARCVAWLPRYGGSGLLWFCISWHESLLPKWWMYWCLLRIYPCTYLISYWINLFLGAHRRGI